MGCCLRRIVMRNLWSSFIGVVSYEILLLCNLRVLAWLNGGDGSDADNSDIKLFRRPTLKITSEPSDVSTGIVEGAQSEQENGLGFGKLWVFTVVIKRHFELLMTKGYSIIYNRKRWILEFIEKQIKLNGHMVIVLAEEQGKTWNLTDASDNKLLKDVTSGYHKASSMVMNLKYVDPAYMIRTVSTNASNTVYFRLLAQSVVHGAVAGYTSYISSLINRRQTYIPYSRIKYKQNNVVITDRVWTRLIFLGPKDIIKEKKELPEKPLLKVKTVMEFSIFLWLLKINK
ncbi:hypothetical protein HID58_052889 [Brassica napus]|uniref:Uncharacterized protein n=1 Tax=Brassica napus TaxID=3708 RepID=A0ABQ8AD48_BRANA|nr:hypothetical protein HID58_052889 [Brassica napus]